MAGTKQQSKQENQLVSLFFNIVIPSVILSKTSGDDLLGPVYALLVALAFPVGYGIYDLIQRKKLSFIAALGFVNILLTGGLGLAQVEGFWFAVKEAAVPLMIGIAVLISSRTKKPMVKAILLNDAVMDVAKVEEALDQNKSKSEFDLLLKSVTNWMAFTFLLSATLNFGLATYLLKSPPGSEQFNVELGKMTAMSYPVIALPCAIVTGFALWKLMKGITHLTGLELQDMMHAKK